MSRCDGATLKAWRQSRGWDAAEIARRLRLTARETGQQVAAPQGLVRMVYGWERGDHALTERYALLYARALGISPDDLARGPHPSPAASVPSADGEGGDDDLQAGGQLAALAPEETPVIPDEGEVERREFFKFAGGMAIAAPSIGDVDRPRRDLDKALGAETSRYDAEEWERVTLEYSSTVGRVPPMQVLPSLLADLDEANRRLKDSRDSVRRRMTRACSLLSALTAIAFLNTGDSESANRHWRTAMRAADLTNDREVQSLIRGRRAVFSLYDRRTPPSSILALASDSIDIADGVPCAGVASGYAARAQVLALLGQHDESIRALRQLGGIFLRLPESTAGDRISQWGWSEQRLRHVESHAYSYAGRLSEATESQKAALALYPKDGYQGRTQVELYRSICIIRGGDPSEGARHAIRTIQALPLSYRSDAVLRHTATLMLHAVPDGASGLSAVSEARELLMLPEGSS